MQRLRDGFSRKAVASERHSHNYESQVLRAGNVNDPTLVGEIEMEEAIPTLPERPVLSLTTTKANSLAESSIGENLELSDTQKSAASASTHSLYGVVSAPSSPLALSSSPTSTADFTMSQSIVSSPMKRTFEDARHFAGGLISRPTESTKHFTVLRHSHGLVSYQASNTTLAVSIFADAPLPPNRTLWLQSKGWSGKTGMQVKALMGVNGKWLNVTPTLAIEPE
jgi:hypothetical protein